MTSVCVDWFHFIERNLLEGRYKCDCLFYTLHIFCKYPTFSFLISHPKRMVLKEWPMIPNTMFIAWMVLTWCVEFLGVQSGWMVANETIYINLQPTLEASHHSSHFWISLNVCSKISSLLDTSMHVWTTCQRIPHSPIPIIHPYGGFPQTGMRDTPSSLDGSWKTPSINGW